MKNHHETDLFGETIDPSAGRSKLHGRFMLPPFSVLNTRDGSWQERKRLWISLGIKGECGRDAACLPDAKVPEYMKGRGNVDGVSVFDPSLTETMYSWFCPPGGMVFDPFAGGSVRGIVATELGYEYTGIELRQEQVEANVQQGNDICAAHKPLWLCGDSAAMDKVLPHGFEADMIFSCPPYGNLEVYSDKPEDISNMEYERFRAAYYNIIGQACMQLKENRFAVFVVANYRDKKGNFNDLVGDTVRAFKQGGLQYYNEAILVNAIGSLPIRITKQFNSARKLGKAHQNILMFVKGDAKRATARITGEGK
jgi:DNA modification methylase